MENTYNYVFHYNHFMGLWCAIPRDIYLEYWNNPDLEGVLKSKNIDTLIDLINKGEQFIKNIKE